MVKSIGVNWVLAGHSERREIFGETNEYINAQCLKIIDEGMSVMLCIGEKLEEFELDLDGSVCEVQLKKGLMGIRKEELDRVAIAYEPVWAIGESSDVNSVVDIDFTSSPDEIRSTYARRLIFL